MVATANSNPLENITETPASDLKRLGWRGVMKGVERAGRVLVTNHREPEAVILSIKEYTALVRASALGESAHESALGALRVSFDERLASLRAPDAADRLRSLINQPTKLDGAVKAGASY